MFQIELDSPPVSGPDQLKPRSYLCECHKLELVK